MKVLVIALGTVLAMPAAAQGASSRDQAPAQVSASVDAQKKYCFTEALSGTRVPTKVCKTKAEWAKEGVDVDHPDA